MHETGYISYLFEAGSFDEKRSKRIQTYPNVSNNPHIHRSSSSSSENILHEHVSIAFNYDDSFDESRLPGVFIGKMISCDDKK